MGFSSKLILNLLLWALVVAAVGGVLLHQFLPAYYTPWFPHIFIGMAVVESFLIYLVEKLSRKVSDTRLVHVYMGVMGGKMFLAIILVTIYALAFGENTRAFAIGFILQYLLFLALESWTFVRLEKYLKEKRMKS
ncbi:MAG: hypothetical protein BGN96_06555 [Bacteroidales bacterium 45-6]|nr:MAG: hypothetical protein BGN96_06555 [Bacteroidales bacterium 45-6]